MSDAWNIGPQRGPRSAPSQARLRAQQRSIQVNDPILIQSGDIDDLRKSPPATLDPSFKMPQAECCGRPMTCEAHNDCGEIFVYLVCDACEKEGSQFVPWPFLEERAGEKDFEAIGIRYV